MRSTKACISTASRGSFPHRPLRSRKKGNECTVPNFAAACYSEHVTKVDIHYDLVRPLADTDEKGIADVHSWYGILRVRVTPDATSIDVEYDASRLTEKDAESVLLRFGIPIQRKWAV
jgi:hypothetical protein